jgi:hypothetical protein
MYARMTKDFRTYLQYEPSFESTIKGSTNKNIADAKFIKKIVTYWRGSGVR